MLLLKVCGLKYAENIIEVAKVHPDFIGFIFHEPSPRNIEKFPIIEIPKNIKKTGVFVDKSMDFIRKKQIEFNLDAVQLHGNETPEFCNQIKELNTLVIKAFNIHANFKFEPLFEYEPFCDYFLFDAFGKKAGGNGLVFNWQLLDNYYGKTPFLLSGGITETMAYEIKKINHQQLVGIDINSGFELEAGLKNSKKIKEFKHALYSR